MEKNSFKEIKENLDIIIEKSIKKCVFTGCSVGFSIKRENEFSRYIYSYGTAEGDNLEKKIFKDTYFDMASLTKPLVTALSLLALVEEKKICLSDTLDTHFGILCPPEKKKIKIHHLLSHSSGLPAHKPYFEKLIEYPENIRKNKIVNWILAEKLCYKPGTENLYSDLGYILLGIIIEKIYGHSLESYWEKKIITPLGLGKKMFFIKKGKNKEGIFAITGNCKWTNRKLLAKVHDDNCRAMGGVAGHAGLFANGEGLLSFCEHLMEQFNGSQQHPAYSQLSLKRFLERTKGSSWTLGFDTPTPGYSSSGKYFSEQSVGHLGFTGTSFWIDLTQKVVIIFLTNRVYCSDKTKKIRELRPVIHNVIMENLLLPRHL